MDAHTSSLPSAWDQQLVLDALRALKDKTAIEGALLELAPSAADNYRADALVELSHSHRTFRYVVECKQRVDRKLSIDQVRRQLPEHGGLLITPYLSKELADHCRTTGLQFLDGCGNAYLRADGLFVFITGEKGDDSPRPSRAPRSLNTAGARVTFALLTQADLLRAPLKDTAQAAGVALGTVYNVFDELAARGYLHNTDRQRRRLLEPDRLLNEWVMNYPFSLRPKLKSRRYAAPDTQWWTAVAKDIPFAWGAEVAASEMTGYLKPVTQTLYVHPDHIDEVTRTLVKQYRFRADPAGPIEILEQFWRLDEGPKQTVAPPLLVYADLLAIMDPRLDETANIIKKGFLDHALDPA